MMNKKRVYSLIGLSFISSSFTFITPLLAPFLILYLSVNEQKASFIMASVFLISGLAQPFFGRLLDLQKYALTTCVSCGLLSLGVLIMVFYIHNIGLFIVGVISIILALKIINISLSKCLMTGLEGDKKGEIYLWHYLSFNLGFFCASLLAYKFIEGNRNTLFALDWLTTISVGLICYWVLRNDHKINKKMNQNTFSVITVFIKHMRRFSGLALIWVLIFSHTMIIPLLYNYLGLDPLKWTLYLLAMNTAGAVLLGVVTKKFLKNIPEKYLLIIGCVFVGFGYAMVPYFIGFYGITLCTVLIILGEVMLVAPQTNLLYRCFSEDNIGLASGVNSVIGSLGKFLCPCLSFVLFKYTHSLKANFSLIFGVMLPVAIIFLLKPYLSNLHKK